MAQKSATTRVARARRHRRGRMKVAGTCERPRLCVFRSPRYIYAQIIDDVRGHTLVTATSLDQQVRVGQKDQPKTALAAQVGSLLARRALERGLKQVVFDRGGYKYHGRVKALAQAVREGGLVL